VVTPYNGKFYFASTVDFGLSVYDNIDANTRQSFAEYYKVNKKLTIENGEQPLILCDLQKLQDEIPLETKNYNCIKLVPELCNITSKMNFLLFLTFLGVPFEIFYYGQLLPSIVEYLTSYVNHHRKVVHWKSRLGITINDYKLLKQVEIFFLSFSN
jgi:hypothetical protein